MKISSFFFIVLILAGCATLSREECQRGDWFGVGMADGQAGEPTSRFDEHVRACSEYGISVDNGEYLKGHAQGLIEYCRIENAFETGLQGHLYKHVCPPSIDSFFDRYNLAAYEVYQLRNEIERIETQIEDKEDKLQKKDLSDKKRRKVRSEIHDLDLRYKQVRGDLRSKENSLDQMMDEAGSLRIP